MEDEEGGVEKGKMTEEMNVKEGHFDQEGREREREGRETRDMRELRFRRIG